MRVLSQLEAAAMFKATSKRAATMANASLVRIQQPTPCTHLMTTRDAYAITGVVELMIVSPKKEKNLNQSPKKQSYLKNLKRQSLVKRRSLVKRQLLVKKQSCLRRQYQKRL